VFFHVISKSVDDFERKLLDTKCVFDFFYKFVLKHLSVEEERIRRYNIINAHKSSRKVVYYSCQISMRLEFPQQIFEKKSNIKFREHPGCGRRVFPREQTDMTKIRVAFRNFGNSPK